jgi:flagellar protein FliL
MSAAPAAKAEEAPKKGGKKKLIIIIAAALVLAGGGGGFVYYTKMKAAAAAHAAEAADDEHDDEAPPKKVVKKGEKKTPPVFMPLDPFIVNLADRQTERYLQLGVTLEVDEAKTSDELKAYMPAIRNNVLMLVSHKIAADLQTQEGKQRLSREIQREVLKPMGIEVELDDGDDEEEDEDAAKKKKKKKKKKKRSTDSYPVTAVHFSSFIIQ